MALALVTIDRKSNVITRRFQDDLGNCHELRHVLRNHQAVETYLVLKRESIKKKV